VIKGDPSTSSDSAAARAVLRRDIKWWRTQVPSE